MIYVKTKAGSVSLVDEKQKYSDAEIMSPEEVTEFEKGQELARQESESEASKVFMKRQDTLKRLSELTGISTEDLESI